ncbi:MAG TPA: hypothetical protein VK578_24395 [Edaphobacter sp.]|nr:hypothetical protein [Edaphobacter sp.]
MLALVLAPTIFSAPGAAQVSVPRIQFPPVGSAGGKVIIIGFVGGFVSQDDAKHPEVQFAAYLRHRYPLIDAVVFGNHHGRKALHEVVGMLDSDGDGVLTPDEKRELTIVIYGHSWGAAETVTFAQALGQMGIPVALTIQIDTIAKPSSKAGIIPANVASAINFYQTRGPLHGLPEIVAADPKQTTILGNILMTYKDRPIDCANYSWYARVFNRPHHKIENDFRVWDRAASLIDSNLSQTTLRVQTSSPSGSPMFAYLRRGFQGRIVASDQRAIGSDQ